MTWRLEKQYKIEITNRFAALENVDDEVVNTAWESIKPQLRRV
jgi:hypothetical protein